MRSTAMAKGQIAVYGELNVYKRKGLGEIEDCDSKLTLNNK
jgi:hypothetical protein